MGQPARGRCLGIVQCNKPDMFPFQCTDIRTSEGLQNVLQGTTISSVGEQILVERKVRF